MRMVNVLVALAPFFVSLSVQGPAGASRFRLIGERRVGDLDERTFVVSSPLITRLREVQQFPPLHDGVPLRARYRKTLHRYSSQPVSLYQPPFQTGGIDPRNFALSRNDYLVPWTYSYWQTFDMDVNQSWFSHATRGYWPLPLTVHAEMGPSVSLAESLVDMILALMLEEGWELRLSAVERRTIDRVHREAKKATTSGCPGEGELIILNENREVYREQQEYIEYVKVRSRDMREHSTQLENTPRTFDLEARKQIGGLIAALMADRAASEDPRTTFERILEEQTFLLVPPRFSKVIPVTSQALEFELHPFEACTLGAGDVLERLTPPVRDQEILLRLVRSPQDRLESVDRGDQHCILQSTALFKTDDLAKILNEFQLRLDLALMLLGDAQHRAKARLSKLPSFWNCLGCLRGFNGRWSPL